MGRSSDAPFKTRYFSANTGGTQIGLCGPDAATTAGTQKIEGIVHGVIISNDTTPTSVSILDGTTSVNTGVSVIVAAANAPLILLGLDVQLNVGLVIVISGGTTVNVTIIYR